jgi:hypothetical protein
MAATYNKGSQVEILPARTEFQGSKRVRGLRLA